MGLEHGHACEMHVECVMMDSGCSGSLRESVFRILLHTVTPQVAHCTRSERCHAKLAREHDRVDSAGVPVRQLASAFFFFPGRRNSRVRSTARLVAQFDLVARPSSRIVQ